EPFLVPLGPALQEHLPVAFLVGQADLAGEQVEVRQSDQLFLGSAAVFFKGGVAAEVNAVRVLVENQIGDGIDQAAKNRALAFQLRMVPSGSSARMASGDAWISARSVSLVSRSCSSARFRSVMSR